MKLSRMYRFLLLAIAGGALFQTTHTSCFHESLTTFGTTFAQEFATSLAALIATAFQAAVTT